VTGRSPTRLYRFRRSNVKAHHQANLAGLANRSAQSRRNDRYVRTTAIVRQWRLPDDLPLSRDLLGVGLRELTRTHPESPRGRRECFRQADGKPELMIDRAPGGASSEQQ
jgi:hypothetical protein